MRVQGVVEQVATMNSSAGTLYGLVIEGTRYGFYRTKPDCKEGQTVEFEATVKGNFVNADVKTFKVTQDKPAAPSTVVAAPAVRSGQSFSDKERQGTIARQWSYNAAINFLALAKDVDALPLPKAAKDRHDVLRAELEKVSEEFYNKAMGIENKDSHQLLVVGSALEQAAASDGPWN